MNLDDFPLVSIIVPVYGVEHYLEQCLKSILQQTLTRIEIILIDDGSTDGCPQIIDKYAALDNRIRAFHQENVGYGKTVNRGLVLARGEYIAIVEPDDWCELKMFERLYLIAKKNDVDIVKSSFSYIFEHNRKVSMSLQKRLQIPYESFTIQDAPLLLFYHPSIWTCIYRREFLSKNKIKMIEVPGAGWTDNPFQVETLIQAKSIVYIDESLYNYRQFSNKKSTNFAIPYARCMEIRDWLKQKDITNSLIVNALYKREIKYLSILITDYPLKKLFQERNKFSQWLGNLPLENLKSSLLVTPSEVKFLMRLQTGAWIWFIFYKLKGMFQGVLKYCYIIFCSKRIVCDMEDSR